MIYQRGMILLTSVLILLVLAALSVGLLSNSVSEKIIAHKIQDTDLATQSAKEAIESAKAALFSAWGLGNTECGGSPCACPGAGPCVWISSLFSGMDLTQQPASFWNSYGTTIISSNPNVVGSPNYMIIDLGCDAIATNNRYRIVAKGVGGAGETAAYLEEMVSVPISPNNVNASTLTAVTAAVDTVPVVGTFTLSPLTVSASFFVNTIASVCPSGISSFAECQMNCSGQVRVMAWTFDNNCAVTYGPWATQLTDVSSVTLNLGGTPHTISCQL